MEGKLELDLAMAEMDVTNPFLTRAKFIFADDGGNQRGQGIEVEDFDEVIKTAIGMPVKMLYNGKNAVGHLGSYVIGHIIGMEKELSDTGPNKLIAEALLYADEYPQEIEFLKKSFAEGTAPGISYEIRYADTIIKNGIQWIKKLYTTAATFVRSPAYGNRTALLALASAKNDEDFIHALRMIMAEAEETSVKETSNEGGINVDELEKVKQEAATLKAEAETKAQEIATLTAQLAEKDATISTLQENVTTLENNAKIESRVRRLAEAGFTLEAEAEKSAKKKSFILKLDDESFEEYLEDIVAAKTPAAPSAPTTVAHASAGLTPVLRPVTDTSSAGGALNFNFRNGNS